MTRKRLFLFLLALLPLVMVSCGDDDDDDLIGKWYRVSDFDGLARSDASEIKAIWFAGMMVKTVCQTCGSMIWTAIPGHKRLTSRGQPETQRWP